MFLVGLVGAGLIGYLLVPITVGERCSSSVSSRDSDDPLRWFMSESPRWLAAKGRYQEAEQIVARLEQSARAGGKSLAEPTPVATTSEPEGEDELGELFKGIYLKRTLTIWTLWFCSLSGGQRYNHLAANTLSPDVQAAACDQPATWISNLGGRRYCSNHLRAPHRQGSAANVGTYSLSSQRHCLCSRLPSSGRHPPIKSCFWQASPMRSSRRLRSRSTSIRRNYTRPAYVRSEQVLWQRVASAWLVHRTDTRRLGHRRVGHPVRVRPVYLRAAGRSISDRSVCGRDGRANPRRAVSVAESSQFGAPAAIGRSRPLFIRVK